jgi:hypothetical protein
MSRRATSDGTFVRTRLVLGTFSPARPRLVTRFLAQPRSVGARVSFVLAGRGIYHPASGRVAYRRGRSAEVAVNHWHCAPEAIRALVSSEADLGAPAQAHISDCPDCLRCHAANTKSRLVSRPRSRDRKPHTSNNPVTRRHSQPGFSASANDWYLNCPRSGRDRSRWRTAHGAPGPPAPGPQCSRPCCGQGSHMPLARRPPTPVLGSQAPRTARHPMPAIAISTPAWKCAFRGARLKTPTVIDGDR